MSIVIHLLIFATGGMFRPGLDNKVRVINMCLTEEADMLSTGLLLVLELQVIVDSMPGAVA